MRCSTIRRQKISRAQNGGALREAAAGRASCDRPRDERPEGVSGDRLLPDDESIRPDDPVLPERLKELAWVRRRFGYWRLNVFLLRQGPEVNHKRWFRIYRDKRLHVRRRGGCSRVICTRVPMDRGWGQRHQHGCAIG